MKKYDVREIRALFERGENVAQWLRTSEGAVNNSPTAIAYSYDMQAGTYNAELEDPSIREFRSQLGQRLAEVLEALAPISLLEAGIGEATSLRPTLAAMVSKPSQVLGFDLSMSRLMYARRHMIEAGQCNVELFVSELARVAMPDSSIDVVLTFHALEPNRGREEEILAELLRITARHLVLIEPSYELGSEETRRWMDRHGYVRGLPDALRRLGFPPRVVEPWPFNQNPVNRAALIIVDKGETQPQLPAHFISPISGRPLVRRPDCYFCPDDGHAFPVIEGIPCLTIENSVLASKLGEF